jgi:hypothetical protein
MGTLQLHSPLWDVAAMDVADAPGFVVRETNQTGPPKPRLLDRVREAIRTRHYSRRTEKAYVAWIRRYIFFHGKRHPADMGAAEITRFLTSLAVEGGSRHRRRTRHSARSSFSTATFLSRRSPGWTTLSMRNARTTCPSC